MNHNLANAYRPRLLSDIVGQETVVRILTNAVQNNALHHAYLLVGTYGSGKTSMARILAAMENCEISPGLNPCGKCDICKDVFAGKHNDIIEIDAASSAGKVEQIRELKKEALFNPINGARKKYFIIDEVHRASTDAADALLKLLEEPPDHCRFVLCTTDVQKLKPTILSRCQRHDFSKIYWSKIADRLEKIAVTENVTVEKIALNMCAKLSHGSMRAALQNLEKLILYAGNESITLAHAQAAFGSADDMKYYDLIDQIIGDDEGKGNSTTAYRIINDILAHGMEFGTLYNDIADHLSNIMIGLTSSNAFEFIYLTDEGKNRLKGQLKRVSQRELEPVLECISKLNEACDNVDHGMPAETALQHWFLACFLIMRRKK